MTLNTEYSPAVYEGNGVVRQFSYDFNPISKDYIKVSLEIDGSWVKQDAGWSATASEYGGIVTFNLAPTVRVSIEREIPSEQPTSFITSDGFDAKVIETSLDKLTGMIQKLEEAVDRSVKLGVGSGENPDELIEAIYGASIIAERAIEASNRAIQSAERAEQIASSINPPEIVATAVSSANAYTNSAKTQAVSEANSYTDSAKEQAKTYTDNKFLVVNSLPSNPDANTFYFVVG